MNMSDRFPSGIPCSWHLPFPFTYPAPAPIPPFQQYVQPRQEIQFISTATSPQVGRLPTPFFPPQSMNRDFGPKRGKKIPIIDPKTNEEVKVEKGIISPNLNDSTADPKLLDLSQIEKLKIQQEFRRGIATAAIKDLDLSPENKIKDEFKSKVSESLIPEFVSHETLCPSSGNNLNTSNFNLQDVNIISENVPDIAKIPQEPLPTMIFSSSSSFTENISRECVPEEGSLTSYSLSGDHYADNRNLIERDTTLLNQIHTYSREDILDRQPQKSAIFNIPIELKESMYFCVSILDIFYYFQVSQTTHSSILEMPLKSREADNMIENLTWILNRITPENYDKLSRKAIEVVGSAETMGDLKSFIHCIFRKAINEPLYCEFYARLCNDMAKIFIRDDSQGGDTEISYSEKQVTFRRCLLTICQQEFEKDKNDNETLILMKLQLESCTDIDQKSLLLEEYQLKEKVVHKHSLGNVRFIGQLYRLNMLSENIIHECTVRLLKGRPSDDYLEELCSLFTVVGKDIDKPEAKDRIDQYFDRIDHLMDRGYMSTRVKYLLMNLIDLRYNGWCERREKEIPKTLDELHNIDSYQSLPISVLKPKDFYSQTQGISKDDNEDLNISNHVKLSGSKLPSLKKLSSERQFRPSGSWSSPLQDFRQSSRLEENLKLQSNQNAFHSTDHHFESSKSLSSKTIRDEMDIGANDVPETEIIKRSISILKEYDHLNDFDEVHQYLQGFYSPSNYSTIICGFFLSLNVSSGKLKSTLIDLLFKCYNQEVLSEQHVIEGIVKVLKHINEEDIAEDCPLIHEFIIDVLISLYSHHSFSLVSLLNLIYLREEDNSEFLQSFLNAFYRNDKKLVLSLITSSNQIILDGLLDILMLNESPLYDDLRNALLCNETLKREIKEISDLEYNLESADYFHYFCCDLVERFNIDNFLKPLFLTELLSFKNLIIDNIYPLQNFATEISIAISCIPRHFHSIIIETLLNTLQAIPSNQSLNCIQKFFSVISFKYIITADLVSEIANHNAVDESIIKSIQTSFTT